MSYYPIPDLINAETCLSCQLSECLEYRGKCHILANGRSTPINPNSLVANKSAILELAKSGITNCKEIESALNLPYGSLTAWARHGKLPAHKILNNKNRLTWHIDTSEL